MRKQVVHFSLAVFAVAVIFTACKDEMEPPVDLGHSYFPGNVGHTLIYDVDSLVYDGFNFGKDTTYHFQIREVIHSEFTDAAGNPAQLIERYRRENENMPWQLMNLWTINRSQSTAEKVEDNQRYVKLVFPPAEGKSWNGNQFNSAEEWEYTYKNLDKPLKVGDFNFDSTVVVEQIDDSNFVNVRRAYEIYARNIGMVYKRIDTLEQKFVGNKLVPDNGVRYHMTLKSYSN